MVIITEQVNHIPYLLALQAREIIESNIRKMGFWFFFQQIGLWFVR